MTIESFLFTSSKMLDNADMNETAKESADKVAAAPVSAC